METRGGKCLLGEPWLFFLTTDRTQIAESLEGIPEKTKSTKGLQTMQELLYKDVTQSIHNVDNVDLCQDTTVGLTYRGMITDVGTLDQQVQKYYHAMSVEKRANHQ